MPAIGVLRYPCDDVHCSSQRAAVPSPRGVWWGLDHNAMHSGQKEHVHKVRLVWRRNTGHVSVPCDDMQGWKNGYWDNYWY